MAIHFISGKPGGGKSLYGLKLLVEELVHGSRVVITNLPIRLPELNAWVQAQFPDKVRDIIGRVWVLTDEQTGEFWTWRPNGVRIPRLSAEDWHRGKKPDYPPDPDGGVLYVIDEVHNFFGARQWAETGRDVLFYLSQHRKLGDSVVCITQAIGNVDKQFRSVAQDFTYLRNISKERYAGFRLPAYFLRKTFGSPPTDTSVPMESGTFRLDVTGLAACYDSARGVGIHGRGDMGERVKGRHWGWFAGGVAAVVVGLFLGVPPLVARVFSVNVPAIKQTVSSPPGMVGTNAGRGAHVPAIVVRSVPPPVPVRSVSGVVVPPVIETNVITGWVNLPGGRRIIALSDGRVLRFPEDPEVQGVGSRGAVIDGKVYRLRP